MPDFDYSNEPVRPLESLLVQKKEPFNAEPHLPYLVRSYITPVQHFFKRNHGPIPLLDAETHAVTFTVDPIPGFNPIPTRTIPTTEIISAFPKATIVAALQCAGNRRTGLDAVKPVKGVLWRDGTVSNAAWSGARLCDVLLAAGIPADWASTPMRNWHVDMEALGDSEEEARYGSSIPLSRAMNPMDDVLLAYEMNGEVLHRDHGYPLRVVVPGIIGARSVKYIGHIRIQPAESASFYQQRDYKILPPHVGEKEAIHYWDRLPALQEMNVQSVVCEPVDGAKITRNAPYSIRGYALSGGGRAIQRVDVSLDGGETWGMADLFPRTQYTQGNGHWGWSLWTFRLSHWPKGKVRIVCRAWDEAGNTQPEDPVWNFRGVMNNAWFHVKDLHFHDLAKQ